MGFLDRIKKKFEKKHDNVLPAEVRMISGCEDAQTSADVSNVASFQLPDPAGKAGGACTSTLLKILYHDHKRPDIELSFLEVLNQAREHLKDSGYTQIPQMSSSVQMDVQQPFDLVPDGCTGTRRSLLIGINYVGMNPGELSGCHNDVHNIKDYIMDVHGFGEENMTILMDDGENEPPTKENIVAGFKKLVEESKPGDAVFVHYSGHGGKLRDDDYGEEDDGYDETLIPVDYQSAGQIRDDDIFHMLVHPLKKGVTLTCLMDCCHSGSVLDLPYKIKADGTHEDMALDEGFDFGGLFKKVGELFDDSDDEE